MFARDQIVVYPLAILEKLAEREAPEPGVYNVAHEP